MRHDTVKLMPPLDSIIEDFEKRMTRMEELYIILARDINETNKTLGIIQAWMKIAP